MVLVENDDGSIYLIDYIDSFRKLEDEDEFDGVEIQYKLVKEFETKPVQELAPTSSLPENPAAYYFDCPHGSPRTGTCWGDSIYQEFTFPVVIDGVSIGDRQEAYDFVQEAKGGAEQRERYQKILDQTDSYFDEYELTANSNGNLADEEKDLSTQSPNSKEILNKLSPAPVPTPAPIPVPDPTPEPTQVPVPVPVPTPEPTLTVTRPNLIKATLRGENITLQFDNVLSDALPSKSRFTLNQRNREYQVVDIEITAADGIVTLTAEKELDPTVSLTLDYLDFVGDQALGVVESSTGVDLKSFTGFPVDNQGSQENLLTIDRGEFEGNQITLFLSAPILGSKPSKRRFEVNSANKKLKIIGISTEPDEGIIVLATKKDLGLQGSVFVTYRDLDGDQVKRVVEDLAGNDMATTKDFEIISSGNNATAPMVESATLDENTLTVEFDSIIRNTTISKNRFKVRANGKKVRVMSAKVEQDDSYVELELKPKNLRAIDYDWPITLAYKDPKGDQFRKVVEDIFGNDLDSFNGYGVEIVKI